MKWSKLISLLVAALGLGTSCCCGPHTFGPGPRNIRNPLDFWPQDAFFALDLFAVLLLVLSYFLCRGRNWARLILISCCIVYCVVTVGGAVALGVEDSNVVDSIFISGLLIWGIAGPLFLVFTLRQPAVVEEFGGRRPNLPARDDAGMAAHLDVERRQAGVPQPGRSAP
jgi:hypothetical protein